MLHEYSNANYWVDYNSQQRAFSNWHEEPPYTYQQKFYEILTYYADKILFQVNGHDHVADFRYQHVPGIDEQFFDNKVLFPGVTAGNNNQPAFSTFTLDTETHKPMDLTFTFLQIMETFGLSKETPIDQLPWFKVPFQEKFGLEDFSGKSINALWMSMIGDGQKARHYMFNRTGVSPLGNPEISKWGIMPFVYQGLVSPGHGMDWKTAFWDGKTTEAAPEFSIAYCQASHSSNAGMLD